MRKANLFLIILIILSAGAVSFLILRSIKGTPEGSVFREVPSSEQILNKEEGSSEITKKPEAVIANDLKSKMPDLERPIITTSNLTEDAKVKAKKEIEDVIALIKSNYDYLQAWLQLGILRKLISDYEGAREAWEFASLLRPKNAISFNNLGELYGFYLKDFLKSEKNYLKSIENDPKNIDAYKNLVTIYQYAYTEKKDQIGPLLLRGVSSNPNDFSLMITLARHYVDVGNLTSAIIYYKNALQIDPNNHMAQEELAELEK